MWKWLLQQLDISSELPRLSAWYMGLSGLIMGVAFVGLYFHYSLQDNRLLGIAIMITLLMSLYERYWIRALKSANLTLFSAVVYSLLML
ncbi:hypothetical protein ACF3NA_10455 [Alkanindiges sp. WGS2144]|uniref:hypothetical protein n=1 Tax=Alkanindiges sp. WGS2144 TaxID=3366808 RepID=UPI003752E2D7